MVRNPALDRVFEMGDLVVQSSKTMVYLVVDNGCEYGRMCKGVLVSNVKNGRIINGTKLIDIRPEMTLETLKQNIEKIQGFDPEFYSIKLRSFNNE